MDILNSPNQAQLCRDTILTIGVFDGVHKGHQELIRAVVSRARATDRLAALVTFVPHPMAVLAPDRAPRYLTTLSQKMTLLEDLGVDLVLLLPFDRKLAAMSAQAFMQMLIRHLRLCELWIGTDFALGHKREGNVPRLRDVGRELGYEVHALEPLTEAGQAISSSWIRALLRQGEVGAVAGLLGRYLGISGWVARSTPRAPKPGTVTASLELSPEAAIPAEGLYAVRAVLGVERHPALAGVNASQSRENDHPAIMLQIPDFDGDISGCDIGIEFVARLRENDFSEMALELAVESVLDSLKVLPVPALLAQARDGSRRLSQPCPYRYREVEHTADRALWVRGETLTDLFAGAARAMYSLMADLSGVVAAEWREIRLESWDQAALLVDWLNELLFLTETEGLVIAEGHIESLDERTLVGRAGGMVAPTTRSQIKAATYHKLELVQDAGGWTTVITFDV